MLILLLPLICLSQSNHAAGGMLGTEMLTLKQGNQHSIFMPVLSQTDESMVKNEWLMQISNPFLINGLNRLHIQWNRELERAALGMVGHLQTGGPISRFNLSANYTQPIMPTMRIGLAMGGNLMRWKGYEGHMNGWVRGKGIYRINEKTSWGNVFGIEVMKGEKGFQISKYWSTQMGQKINKDLFMGLMLEKQDGIDATMEMILEWRLIKQTILLGGFNLSNGSLMLGWQRVGQRNRKGISISNHPLLGYGLELGYYHAIN